MPRGGKWCRFWAIYGAATRVQEEEVLRDPAGNANRRNCKNKKHADGETYF